MRAADKHWFKGNRLTLHSKLTALSRTRGGLTISCGELDQLSSRKLCKAEHTLGSGVSPLNAHSSISSGASIEHELAASINLRKKLLNQSNPDQGYYTTRRRGRTVR